ncbi:phosphatidylserine decarboxylase [Helicobacter sp. 11S02596-1]|uniref:phosphatidylserine decarboxylase n=1 Tax=Helicobacter sp. 11S02596-1 TaxID=1476194 RepID=UPI000BA7CB02|nr:phosphatidylserine decarboxylase [Helicobacter sp. 11S02596-1]PAF44744.1 hypothetical protein BJI48_01790 [Helicobacter sp. 11S02596-1]
MTSTQIIAKEGYKGAIVLLVLFLVFLWLDWGLLIFLSFLCLLLWLFAFRNPERLPDDRFNPIVLAPIDGKIEKISAHADRLHICIAVDWLDVGIIRAPSDIVSYEVCKKSGLFLRYCQEELKNALNTKITFSSQAQHCFEMELFPEIFSSATFYEKTHCTINDRMGFMKLGRLELRFPAKLLDIKVNIGDKIKGGQTLIGYIK